VQWKPQRALQIGRAATPTNLGLRKTEILTGSKLYCRPGFHRKQPSPIVTVFFCVDAQASMQCEG